MCVASRLQNDLPHALREYAHILALRGKVRCSCRLFEKSLSVAERQGAAYEHAQTLLIYGQLQHELGHAGRERANRRRRSGFATDRHPSRGGRPRRPRQAAPATLSLADRFDTVLEVGRKITSALSPAMIFAEVRAAALRLLRGEHCLVLEIANEEGQHRFTPVAGSADWASTSRH